MKTKFFISGPGRLLPTMLAALIFTVQAQAQTVRDTVLQEFKVHSRHKHSGDSRLSDFAQGQKVSPVDSAVLHQYQLQSLASMLTQQVPVFVKSYGFNGLATLNFRGSSAAQSAVLWNGIPIQNAALGIADVSTLPVSFMNKVSIVYGGSSALWGSGNVGGALVLESETPVFDSGKQALAVSAGIGSFGQYIAGLNGSISRRRWYFSGNVFAQTALNNFPYTGETGVKANMPNSHLQSGALMLRGAVKTGTHSVVSLTGWYQQYDRQIPPALPEAYSVKRQLDGSLRIVAEWTRRTAAGSWYARSSIIRDEVDYNDSAIHLQTNYSVYQYYHEAGWTKDWGRAGQLLLFAPLQLSWLQGQGSSAHQSKVALAAAWSLSKINNRLHLSAQLRAGDMATSGPHQHQQQIVLPGGGASFALARWLTLRANAQRTFRDPTLNELYYFPGGNADLNPERGWTEDAGYTLNIKYKKWSMHHDLSEYNRNIHDWILWIGGAIWTPHNISEVHSRGVETENNITYTTGQWQLHLGVNTAYVLATTVHSYIYNDGSSGKQIPYTPRYNGQLNVGVSYRNITVNYNHTYTGYRFTTSDESYYLLPYQTGNVQLSARLRYDGRTLQLSGQCNNIWNEKYQVVALRPMPGINWLMTAKMDIIRSTN